MKKIQFTILFSLFINLTFGQNIKFALVKYNGGGDWYANPTALSNLSEFCNSELSTNIDADYATVELASPDIFNYPFLHLTGHGNVVLSNEESKNLIHYLQAGGFLHIDDNYGMDVFIRAELKKLFPNNELVAIPRNHAIFNGYFKFPEGLPKIHEHDNKPPEALGIFLEGQLVLLYTYESDLSDGWEDASVHNDSEEKRFQALKMGANIIEFTFKGK